MQLKCTRCRIQLTTNITAAKHTTIHNNIRLGRESTSSNRQNDHEEIDGHFDGWVLSRPITLTPCSQEFQNHYSNNSWDVLQLLFSHFCIIYFIIETCKIHGENTFRTQNIYSVVWVPESICFLNFTWPNCKIRISGPSSTSTVKGKLNRQPPANL